MIRRPPRSTRTDTLFPYTTLFRSERLRFLSISGTNLDEFFMVRVAGLKGQQLQDVDLPSADGLTPTQQLQAIAADAARLQTDQQRAWTAIYGELDRDGTEEVGEGRMDKTAEEWAEQHLLTPVYLDNI